VFLLPHLNAVKIFSPARSPRDPRKTPVTQGSPEDRDMHAVQSYVPLLDLAIPATTTRD
jgi:hypothetical protein